MCFYKCDKSFIISVKYYLKLQSKEEQRKRIKNPPKINNRKRTFTDMRKLVKNSFYVGRGKGRKKSKNSSSPIGF